MDFQALQSVVQEHVTSTDPEAALTWCLGLRDVVAADCGGDGPDLAGTLACIAAVYEEHGDVSRALYWRDDEIAVLEALYGDASAPVLAALEHLVSLAVLDGDAPRAEEVLRRLVRGAISAFGSDDPRTLDALELQGRTMLAMGWGARAEEVLRRVATGREARFGDRDLRTVESFALLARVCEAQGHLQDAVVYLGRVHDAYCLNPGVDHEQTNAVRLALEELRTRVDTSLDAVGTVADGSGGSAATVADSDGAEEPRVAMHEGMPIDQERGADSHGAEEPRVDCAPDSVAVPSEPDACDHAVQSGPLAPMHPEEPVDALQDLDSILDVLNDSPVAQTPSTGAELPVRSVKRYSGHYARVAQWLASVEKRLQSAEVFRSEGESAGPMPFESPEPVGPVFETPSSGELTSLPGSG